MADQPQTTLTINGIGAQPEPAAAPVTGLGVLKAFNPLGPVAEMYARTLAYKIETQRLNAELERIQLQADVAHAIIGKTFALKMAELANRRRELADFYQTVNKELNDLHVERASVLDMARTAQQQAFAPGIPLEERQFYKDMALELLSELPKFADKANASLQQLIQALPTVQVPPGLLSA